jgi:hypothetical protein
MMVTDAELIFWAVACIAGWIGFGILWYFAKKDAENYVELEGRRK